MSEYTAGQVEEIADWCMANSSGVYRNSAIAAHMLLAYADTLSKPADSGRVGDIEAAYRYSAPSWQEISAAEGDAIAALKVLHHAGSLINAQLPGTAQLCAKWPSLIGTIKAALAAQGQGDGGPGFGLSDGDVAALRDAGLKPEEIAGDAVKQQARVSELVHWFARFLSGSANPKWITSHAMELAYYIATNAGNRHIDVSEIHQAGFKSGLNVTPAQRSMLESIGIANPASPASPVGVSDECNAAVEAIQFALHGEEGLAFLRCWNEGNFDACREEWPEAPAACYLGVDPLLAAAPSQPEDAA